MDIESGQESQQDSVPMQATGNASSSSESSSFEILRGAIEKSVNKLTSKNKIFPPVKENFEPLYRKDSKYVVELFKSMMDQLKSMIHEEIDLQLHCNNVEQLLGELDTLKQGGKTGQKRWRPSGDPHEDLKAHLFDSKEKELEHYEKIHNSLLFKNRLLNESVDREKQRLDSSRQKLNAISNEWEEAATAIPETTKRDLVKIALELPMIVKTDAETSKLCTDL